ncbi:hypothetical protein I7I51_03012 [Histoplasma capsulatum]|uniref:Uncharacterized protein n=1 Tax=Ajellomyces capsulatus TaxID=5037 RepID=A0A8A1MNK8_AJECA|nr:hypothetical protein I7I51_03012 [Histoplasma capsulatum]
MGGARRTAIKSALRTLPRLGSNIYYVIEWPLSDIFYLTSYQFIATDNQLRRGYPIADVMSFVTPQSHVSKFIDLIISSQDSYKRKRPFIWSCQIHEPQVTSTAVFTLLVTQYSDRVAPSGDSDCLDLLPIEQGRERGILDAKVLDSSIDFESVDVNRVTMITGSVPSQTQKVKIGVYSVDRSAFLLDTTYSQIPEALVQQYIKICPTCSPVLSEPLVPALEGFPNVVEFDKRMASYIKHLPDEFRDKATISWSMAGKIGKTLYDSTSQEDSICRLTGRPSIGAAEQGTGWRLILFRSRRKGYPTVIDTGWHINHWCGGGSEGTWTLYGQRDLRKLNNLDIV